MLERINKSEALRYMGCKPDNVDENVMSVVDECERVLIDNIKPKYVYRFFNIAHTDDGVAVDGTDLVLKGRDIYNHLAGCDRAVFIAATLSAEADKVIRKYEITNMAYALAADALASAAIEQVCDIAENEIRRSAENMTWRFSPGYGDLPIEQQSQFVAVVDAQRKIGLTLTQNNILIPRKSVTAVIGISKNSLPYRRRGCAICSMRENCRYRKGGMHCGTV